MDKIEKFLKKLSPKEREVVQHIVEKVLSNNIDNLDVKRVKGEQNLFRVRKGNVRMVFFKEGTITRIIFIGRRGEKTYRNF